MIEHSLDFEKQTVSKITRRLIPFLFLLYIISYLDRVNIGYAALQMNADLGLSNKVFGIASGIFFIGYFLFEVPSNIMLHRFGARKWIARILITWGLVATLTGFAQNANHLYILRFLLGVCEAGFFPGVILYLTYWYRGKDMAKAVALFMAAIAVSFILGAPISGWIMDNVQLYNMSGWRWMLILEGLPAIILGFVTFFYLTDRPDDATWLTEEERNWIIGELEKEKASKPVQQRPSIKDAFKDIRVWILALIYFLATTGGLGIGIWLPQIIKGLSKMFTNTQVGLITMIPYIFAAIAMNIWGRHSDRTGERFYHTALPLFLSAVGMIGIGYVTHSPIISIIIIVFTLASKYCFNGPFWALPPYFLAGGSAAAAGIAFINSVGNLGGFLGPFMMGALKDLTGGVSAGLYSLGGCIILACLLLLWMRKKYSH
jgi:ACS family tartrate transporter-like MFS transporter